MTTAERAAYKAKRMYSNDWIKGYYFKSEAGTSIIRISDDDYHEIDPETLCQFTGLKDKNGNMIFEGDEVNDSNMDKGFVYWNNSESWFSYVGQNGEEYNLTQNLELTGKNIWD